MLETLLIPETGLKHERLKLEIIALSQLETLLIPETGLKQYNYFFFISLYQP